jgi:hypothetical protein
MEHTMAFAGLALATLASFAAALVLVWLSLLGFFFFAQRCLAVRAAATRESLIRTGGLGLPAEPVLSSGTAEGH